MRRRMQGTLFVITACLALVAWRYPATPMTLKEGSRLWFDGTSTLRSWSCTAPRIDAVIDADANAPAAVLSGQKAVKTVTLTFPVAQLDCDNKTMNGHMLKALNADRYANIRFTLTGYELAKTADVSGTLQGTLALHGQTRPITVAAKFAPSGSGLRVTGKYDLKMTDWGVEPPKLMMGTLKVGDVVNVQFDLLLQP